MNEELMMKSLGLLEHELLDDEYVNEDNGLIYCKKCGKPRQGVKEVMGKKIYPMYRCPCQQKHYEEQMEERERKERMEAIARMKATGLQDPMLYQFTFEGDMGINSQMIFARRYVENWEIMQEQNQGYLLWGDVGSGKSFFAGCIANALLDQGIPVLMTNFNRILNTLSGLYSNEKNNFVDSLNKYSLLIIDDLGIERHSDYALEQVFSVIDGRYRSMKPLIITTNLTMDEFRDPIDLAHKRIYDRILEMCAPLMFDHPSIREERAKANLEALQELFS